MNELSSVILCGGRSRRMGQDKAKLNWNGQDLLDVIAGNLSTLGKVFLSADHKERFSSKPYPVVEDRYPGCGPLGGVCTALLACKTPFLFVVCCDMPFVTGETGRMLQSHLGQSNAAVPREDTGRIHPLCAVYRRDAAPLLIQQLQTGNFRMMDAMECLQTVYVPAEELPGGVRVLCNVNTPEEFRKAGQAGIGPLY